MHRETNKENYKPVQGHAITISAENAKHSTEVHMYRNAQGKRAEHCACNTGTGKKWQTPWTP
jgi:hypothetical protein